MDPCLDVETHLTKLRELVRKLTDENARLITENARLVRENGELLDHVFELQRMTQRLVVPMDHD